MGLIRAVGGSIRGTFGDQWKEFFYCESLDKTVLMTKGEKKVTKRFGSNHRGNDKIISNGSGIAVADGQCMIIVEQGKIMDICSEPGEYTYDKGSEPSIFTGNLWKGVAGMFRTMWERIGYGGDSGKGSVPPVQRKQYARCHDPRGRFPPLSGEDVQQDRGAHPRAEDHGRPESGCDGLSASAAAGLQDRFQPAAAQRRALLLHRLPLHCGSRRLCPR